MPSAPARRTRRWSIAVPSPFPCQWSTTMIATSASFFGFRSGRSGRRRDQPSSGSIADQRLVVAVVDLSQVSEVALAQPLDRGEESLVAGLG